MYAAWQVRSHKKLELRMQARSDYDRAFVSLCRLSDAQIQAIRSREDLATLAGSSRSAAMIAFKEKTDGDSKSMQSWADMLPREPGNYRDLTILELEERIADYGLAQQFIDALKAEYDEQIASDDAMRERLAADKRLTQPPIPAPKRI